MLARVRSAAVLGIDAVLVDVETDIADGLPTFTTVGLPQGVVGEGGRARMRDGGELATPQGLQSAFYGFAIPPSTSSTRTL